VTALTALALASCGGGSTSGVINNPTPTPSPSPSPTPTPSGAFSLFYSTLLDGASGTTYEMARGMAIDAQGNIYVTGGTTAADFPTTAGAYSRTFGGNAGGSATAVGAQGPGDVFVVKMSPAGKILWSTLLGGPNYDRAYAIRVGSDGSVYVAGRAGPGFPTTSGVVQPSFAGDNGPTSEYGKQDGFVAKLSADGSTLLWSTYIGDSDGAFIRDIDVDSQGRTYIGLAMITKPIPALITSNAWQATMGDQQDDAYIRLSSDAKRVEYGTYLGGTPGATGATTEVPSIKVASDGSVVVAFGEKGAGMTTSANAYQRTNAGGFDMAVVKFTNTDTLSFSTYFGGSGDENGETHFLALDSLGRVYITGTTSSSNMPVTTGTYQQRFGGGANDGFLAVLSADGSRLLASTYIGGNGVDPGQGIEIAQKNGAPDSVVLGLSSSSTNITGTAGAFQTTNQGGTDAAIAVFSTDLVSLRYLSFIGGSAEDAGRTLAISPDGSNLYIGGHTLSGNFPTTADAIDRQLNGTYAGWVAFFRANP